MQWKGLAVGMGVGVAAGAAAMMLMPKDWTGDKAAKAVKKAACTVKQDLKDVSL